MSCTQPGNADMYGLGIRISFYLQWFGAIFASYLAPSEVPGLRLSLVFFISATFLALIIQASWTTITPLDIYITLLLTYGAYYAYIPIYFWRILTFCNPFWDPTRWPRVPVTGFYRRANLVLLMAVSGFQIWFWGVGINELDGGFVVDDGDGDGVVDGCQEWGFFFTKVPLHAGLFIAVNIFFAVALLICVLVSMGFDVGIIWMPRWMRRREKYFNRELDRWEAKGEEYPWIPALRFLLSVSNVLVATTVIIATELTIQWNNLTDVNDVSTAGQTIPVIIAAGLLAHVLYVWINPDHDRVIRRALNPNKRRSRPTPGHHPPPLYFMPPPHSPRRPPAAAQGS